MHIYIYTFRDISNHQGLSHWGIEEVMMKTGLTSAQSLCEFLLQKARFGSKFTAVTSMCRRDGIWIIPKSSQIRQCTSPRFIDELFIYSCWISPKIIPISFKIHIFRYIYILYIYHTYHISIQFCLFFFECPKSFNAWVKASRPYFDMMSLWVYEGRLEDPYNEFFVLRA